MSHQTRRLLLSIPAVVLVLAACGGSAAGPSPDATAGPAGTPRPTPTAVPGDPGSGGGGTDPGSGGTDPGSGGGSGSNPGNGVTFPIPGGGGAPNQDPLFGDANYGAPGKDLIDPHPVNVQLVRALQNDDGAVIADLRWWSGVAPCNQLDHVEIATDEAAKTIRFTVIEGSGRGDFACIEIAQLNATIVDLGVLAPGSWTLSADGDAPAITLEVS
jgi:hypothetical protein